MTELNRLLRQAARITAGVTPQPNTEKAIADHKGDLGYEVALDGAKTAAHKKADESPNIPGSFADESHKGDAAYETAMEHNGSHKKAEFPPAAPTEEVAEVAEETDPAPQSVTNADIVEALEDVKQGIEDAKVEAEGTPGGDLLQAISDVLDAVESIQTAVSEDAMGDPEAQETFKSAANFKAFFIKERNIKAAKMIRQKLAAAEAPAAPAPKQASVKRAFDPSTVQQTSLLRK